MCGGVYKDDVFYSPIRYCLKAGKSFDIGILCFSPCIKAAKRAGISTVVPITASTVSLNFAGWAGLSFLELF